ncbi:hypothetical protein ACLB2K_047714 [Fragaria x ananassa]
MCILLPWDGYLLYLKISELLCCILLVIIPWLSFQISWRMNVSEKTGTCLPYHPSSPSSKSDYLVMAVNRWKRLAFCRPGGDGWTIVNEEHVNHPAYHDITYYKGQYYIVDAEGQVWVCDIDDPKQARKRALNGHPIPVKPENFNQGQFYYLMESGGVLLTVQCTTKNYERRYFRVFEVPFDNGDWLDSEVTNLGNRTLFLGSCSSFSVEASTYSGCKTNCIYFNQPLYGCSNFGVFTMEDRKINKNVAEYSGSLIPQFWIQPSL